jgi:serine/threonine-protein kinase
MGAEGEAILAAMDDGPPLSSSRESETLSGKYRLDKRLGEGGMGEVYRATNVLIGREVAIKVLRPEHAKNKEIVARFLREARAANIVRHPHVVDVLDIGQDEQGTPFIVQELLEGEDLSETLARAGGRLPVDVAIRILLPVVDAVAMGHSKGVVHRDLKPANVFLVRKDKEIVPKLLDFGISQITQAPGEKKMTLAGTAMGTPDYMSPEQIKGYDVDARTDIWALGVMLYELVAGTTPFQGAETHAALFVQICTEDPVPLARVAEGVPKAVCDVIARCMDRDKAKRYPDAAALGEALRAAQHDVTDHAPHAVPVSKSAPKAAPPATQLETPVDEAPMKVPSLAPPAPPPPKPAPARPNPPAPKPAPALAPVGRAPPSPAAPPARQGTQLALASIRPPPSRNIATAPPVRERSRPDTKRSVVPTGLFIFTLAMAMGFGAAQVAYSRFELNQAIAAVDLGLARIGGSVVLFVIGVACARSSYRNICNEGGGRPMGIMGTIFAAVCVFAAVKLLIASGS